MLEFRITKYDPALRDANGAFLGDDWIFFGEIGETFNGKELTITEYERVERAYVVTAVQFLRDSGIQSLVVSGLENYSDQPVALSNGSSLSLDQIASTLPSLLRGEFWCRLEGPEAFVHVGYDYYMYVGTPSDSTAARQFAAIHGLFVEPFESPYKDDGEECDDSAA